jgi:hypothetical protein
MRALLAVVVALPLLQQAPAAVPAQAATAAITSSGFHKGTVAAE